jgi:glycosyltransferase involved in cell wall biosynthesis
MKICLIGNQNIFIYNFAKYYIQEHGFEVYLISRNSVNYTAESFGFLKIYYLKSERLVSKICAIRNLIKKIKPDIVHCFYLSRDAIAPCLLYPRKFKYVCSIFGSDIYWETKRNFDCWLKGMILKLCDVITFNSYQMVKDLLKLYPFLPIEKIKPIVWGVDFDLFNKVDRSKIDQKRVELGLSDEIIVLSYRGFKSIYNQDIIFKAIPLVVQKYKQVKFIFILGNTKLSAIRPLLDYVPPEILQNHVILVDRFLGSKELSVFLNISDIVINIPKTDQIAQSLLETLASKAIPILSDLKVYRDLLVDRENALFLNEVNERELADCIAYAIDNYSLLKNTMVPRNNGIIQSKYNFKHQVEKIIQLYI